MRLTRIAVLICLLFAVAALSQTAPPPDLDAWVARSMQTFEVPGILVGHSFGGMDVRMYANKYPAEVVGLVLVDSSHPDQDDRFPPEAKKLSAISHLLVRVVQLTLPIGLPRLLTSRTVPAEIRPEFCAVLSQNFNDNR